MEKREIEAARWFSQAEEDLKAASSFLEKEGYNWVCFIAQQAAEKALKAVYYFRDEGVEWVHSLYILIEGDINRGIKGIPELKNLLDEARELDKVYVPTRYPNGLPYGIPSQFYTKKDGQRCLVIASQIIGETKKLLPIT
ncbi:MAG: HEPN domain-containing protein [bacterium]